MIIHCFDQTLNYKRHLIMGRTNKYIFSVRSLTHSKRIFIDIYEVMRGTGMHAQGMPYRQSGNCGDKCYLFDTTVLLHGGYIYYKFIILYDSAGKMPQNDIFVMITDSRVLHTICEKSSQFNWVKKKTATPSTLKWMLDSNWQREMLLK